MESVVDLLFEAKTLKALPRSGYAFLGVGRESVAEHTYMTAIIGFVMAQLAPSLNVRTLLTMCLLHDLSEARIGDLNYVQKKYVKAQENKALMDTVQALPFGQAILQIITEFNQNQSEEARHAHDADQLALLLELKELVDIGALPPKSWLPHVIGRLQTPLGRQLAQSILDTGRDHWWMKSFIDSPD